MDQFDQRQLSEIALLEKSGEFASLWELAKHLNIPIESLNKIRQSETYQNFLKAAQAPPPSLYAPLATQESVEKAFNEQVGLCLRTLVELRDDPDNDSKTRLAAAKEILTLASNARKNQKTDDAPRVQIVIGDTQFKNMKNLLSDDGDTEILDMLKGRDYTDDEA